MSHRQLQTTSGYYRIGETRRREAIDRVTAIVVRPPRNRIWREAQALLDSEHARRPSVRSPSLCVCTDRPMSKPAVEPARSGSAALAVTISASTSPPPRSAGLSRRLAAHPRTPARHHRPRRLGSTEAMPSEEEIRRIRRLIYQITPDELQPEQRQQLQQAVTVMRRHHAVMLGMPRTRQPLPDLRPERTP